MRFAKLHIARLTPIFGSCDPYQASSYLVNPQSWNRYSYVENDPIHNIDPQGLFASYPTLDPCCSAEHCGGDDSEPTEPQAPRSCAIRTSLNGRVVGRYGRRTRNPDVNPNRMPNGPFVSTIVDAQGGRHTYYGYQFEAIVSKENMTDSGWGFVQRVFSSVVFTYTDLNGNLVRRTFSGLDKNPDEQRPENHSDLHNDPDFHSWVDGPGLGPNIPFTFSDELGNAYLVSSIEQTFNIVFEATNGSVFCTGALRLRVRLSGVDTGNVSAVWSF